MHMGFREILMVSIVAGFLGAAGATPFVLALFCKCH